MSRNLLVTPAAETDLDEIWLSIALDSPKAADKLVDGIYERVEPLRRFPQLGPERSDMAPEMRVLTEGRYLILYQIFDERIEIVRVIHGARDLSELL